MANSFNKEERIQFETLLQGFSDGLQATRNVRINNTDQTMMERTGNTIWRPQPYIARSYDGTDQTANFKDQTQLSVPATIGYTQASPWVMTATELRDALQEKRLGDAARQKLASYINVAVLTVASLQGTVVVRSTSAAQGFEDVANLDGAFNRVGVQGWDRALTLSTFTYNKLAKDLATRANITKVTEEAYRTGNVGEVCGFSTWKLDYALRIAAAGGGTPTMDTRLAAANYWTPMATRTAATGERSNVDNRYQQIAVSATTGWAAGDCFTIANVDEVHHITKADTGNLKTFRVISVDDGTHATISPPIISAQGGTQAEIMYKNCIVNATSATAAIVFLNTVAADINPFWQKDAIELLPGRFSVPTDAGAMVMKGRTDQGIELVMQKQYDIKTMKTLYRMDVIFGVTLVQPEMAGIAIFSQT